MEDRFRIASSPIAVPPRLEPRAKSRMVVDLAVVDDPDGLILVRHRLVTTRHVDDCQPSVSEPDRSFDQEALAVRPSVPEHVAHPVDARLVHDLTRIQLDDAHNSAHWC